MAHAQENTQSNPSTRGLAQQFRLSSPAFADGGAIPTRHTADGENVSPQLTWFDPPDQTQSFALLCEDPDAPKGTFVHWLAWNIAPETRALSEGVLAMDFLQGRNGFGDAGYGGPSPPPGAPHRYVFRVFALDTRLDLEAGAGRAAFDRAIEGHILGESMLIGLYGR